MPLISVHLAKWPKADETQIDETLNREMELVMKLVSLGHNARQKANRKVRQPLAEAAFHLARPDERHAVETYADLITDELNVKKVRLLDATGEAVSFVVKPLPKQLGQKYGNKFPGLAKAISALDASVAAPEFLSGQPVKVILEGAEVWHPARRSGSASAGEGRILPLPTTGHTWPRWSLSSDPGTGAGRPCARVRPQSSRPAQDCEPGCGRSHQGLRDGDAWPEGCDRGQPGLRHC